MANTRNMLGVDPASNKKGKKDPLQTQVHNALTNIIFNHIYSKKLTFMHFQLYIFYFIIQIKNKPKLEKQKKLTRKL